MIKIHKLKFGMVSRTVLATAAAAIIASATPVVAAPGGGSGGGGGGLPAAPAGPQIDPEQSYRDGIAALQEGDYKEAEKKFGEVLRVARDNPEANYYMGLAKVGREKEKSSVRYFKRAIKNRASFVEAREQLGLVYVNLEDYEDAQEQVDALNQILADCNAGECDDAYIARTEVAISRIETALNAGDGDADEISAAPANQKFAAIVSAPREVGVDHYNGAVRLINEERYQDAIAELYRAQSIVGPHPDILNYLGYSHRKSGDFAQAVSYYAQALDLDPDHLGATEYLGELYLELGEIKKARRQLAKLDRLCTFGCAEREDLARLIAVKESVRRASR